MKRLLVAVLAGAAFVAYYRYLRRMVEREDELFAPSYETTLLYERLGSMNEPPKFERNEGSFLDFLRYGA